MYSFELFILFISTTALFAAIPGPAMAYAVARTLARGRKAGYRAAFGIHLGGYVHIAAAAAGLTALCHAVPTLYLIIKAFGAAYLIWLGLSIALSTFRRDSEAPNMIEGSGEKPFLESVAVEVFNPKTGLFFLAFLPQFVDYGIDAPIWLQILILGAIVNLMFSLADVILVALAGALVERVRSSSGLRKTLQRLGGGILVGLGLHLFFQRG
jgi:threonine/homoserine/homoserine lactone efflux protein